MDNLPASDSEINLMLAEFYNNKKVKHFHKDGLHLCEDTQRRYDLVISNDHEFCSKPKERKFSWGDLS